ncbi:hypothetical protein PMZ80_009938 [Knufia obscura]|uniref:SGNH hydrolase-type esterase domain-containing protein n=1 Tax=Knufia obscura TaxID=1635080 RepID=A0ABR0RCF5_9EURO|nr:hypothetical protein PMZ80_009938 [Knufia obscura]
MDSSQAHPTSPLPNPRLHHPSRHPLNQRPHHQHLNTPLPRLPAHPPRLLPPIPLPPSRHPRHLRQLHLPPPPAMHPLLPRPAHPLLPLCPDRPSFLRAFSNGGRIGFDAPFMPRACDMRWYTTPETCDILSRFEKVVVVGDSMMRHVVGALNVLLREDLGYGAVTGWNFGEEEMEQCFCMHQMDVRACSVQGVYRTGDVLAHDPGSFACEKATRRRKIKGEDGKTTTVVEMTSPVNLIIELMLKFPHDPSEIERFKGLLPVKRPERPIAFVFGHGLWNDLDLQATVNWLGGVLEAMYEAAPYLRVENLPREGVSQTNADADSSTPPAPAAHGEGKSKEKKHTKPMAHILFITPNAAGPLKPDQWIQSQGDKALQIFEKSMHNLIHREGEMFYGKGIEHMGTWNMSVQMDKWDGVHLDLKGNLIKAMGVMNWLGGIETELWVEQ